MWSLTQDLRGLGNVPCSGVQDITGATVANCGTGPEGARDAWKIVTAVNAHQELVDALTAMLAVYPPDCLVWHTARATLRKVQS